jgi:hypothetical protein
MLLTLDVIASSYPPSICFIAIYNPRLLSLSPPCAIFSPTPRRMPRGASRRQYPLSQSAGYRHPAWLLAELDDAEL